MRVRSFASLALAFTSLVLSAPASFAAGARITVTHTLNAPRADEVVSVPYTEIKKLIPEARMYHLEVRDSRGKLVPSQVTNYAHDHHGAEYDDLVFVASLPAAGKPAVFTVTNNPKASPPEPACVYARSVAERYDDIAWENDRIAHRMYAAALNSPAAGRERLRGSGIDVWGKRVRYPIIDRWYQKGHDQFHEDQEGEGLDLYSVGGSRGAGGTGIWDGKKLWTSDNFARAQVLSAGPRRAVFDLGYETWNAPGTGDVAESKRFTVDCAQQFDLIDTQFNFQADEAIVGLGLTQHPPAKDFPEAVMTKDEGGQWMSLWEENKDGGLGVAVILAPGMVSAGYAYEPGLATGSNSNHLLLVKVRDGVPLRHYAGAGWTGNGIFKNRAAWETHVRERAARVAAPISVTVSAAP
jgi:hypothetical protein